MLTQLETFKEEQNPYLQKELNDLSWYLSAYNTVQKTPLPRGLKLRAVQGLQRKMIFRLAVIQDECIFIDRGDGKLEYPGSIGEDPRDFLPAATIIPIVNTELFAPEAATVLKEALSVIALRKEILGYIPLLKVLTPQEEMPELAKSLVKQYSYNMLTETNNLKLRWLCENDRLVADVLMEEYEWLQKIDSDKLDKPASLMMLNTQLAIFDDTWVAKWLKHEVIRNPGKFIDQMDLLLPYLNENTLENLDTGVAEIIYTNIFGMNQKYRLGVFRAINYVYWRKEYANFKAEAVLDEKKLIERVIMQFQNSEFAQGLSEQARAEIMNNMQNTDLRTAAMLEYFAESSTSYHLSEMLKGLRIDADVFVDYLSSFFNVGTLKEMASKNEDYRFHLAVVLMNTSYQDLDPELIKILGINKSDSSLSLKLISEWNLCANAEERMLNALKEGVIVEQDDMLIKLIGQVVATPRTNIATDKHTVLAGMFYSPSGAMRTSAIQQQNDRRAILNTPKPVFYLGRSCNDSAVVASARDYQARIKIPAFYRSREKKTLVRLGSEIE